jgi:hypothetical protein
VLAIFLPSLTVSHASESLSCIGLIAGTVSGEGTTAAFVRCTVGMAGSGGDNASTLVSVEGFSALDVEAGIGVDKEGLE